MKLRKFAEMESIVSQHKDNYTSDEVIESFEPPRPKFPLVRIIGESDADFCEHCGSGLVKKGLFWKQIIGCRNKDCRNYYKSF